ncbi:hypothetical protein BGZ57DRAFT_108202 [Hyaloscypha finlandica]|nr:hypothetical protein BGZ57DRAFT_108202 [Hyaloscypha finlandica]
MKLLALCIFLTTIYAIPNPRAIALVKERSCQTKYACECKGHTWYDCYGMCECKGAHWCAQTGDATCPGISTGPPVVNT